MILEKQDFDILGWFKKHYNIGSLPESISTYEEEFFILALEELGYEVIRCIDDKIIILQKVGDKYKSIKEIEVA